MHGMRSATCTPVALNNSILRGLLVCDTSTCFSKNGQNIFFAAHLLVERRLSVLPLP